MATRSNIIVQRADGKFSRIYCHFDGYVSHHGPILLGHYADQERAESLVSFGDMSYLDERNDKPEGHSYATPAKGCTVYYGRDRGEDGVDAQVFDTLPEALARPTEEYAYVWQGGIWSVSAYGGTWRPLADAVADKDAD